MDSSLTPLAAPDSHETHPPVDLSELKTAAEAAWKDAQVKFEALLKDGQQYVKANPGKSVLAALGLGFVLGMIFKD